MIFMNCNCDLKGKAFPLKRILHAAQKNRVEISCIFMPSTRCRTWIAFYFQLRNTFHLSTKPLERILNCYTLNLLFDKLLSSQWWCFFFFHSLTYCDGAQYGIITIAVGFAGGISEWKQTEEELRRVFVNILHLEMK